MKKMGLMVLTIAWLSGCSTYTKLECESMDQIQLGYLSGTSGEASHNPALMDFQKNCTKEYDLKPNEEKIKQGWVLGHRYYCSEDGGSNVGISGKKYSGVCSKEEEKVFLKTYNPARMSFLEKRIIELESELEEARSEADSATSSLRSCESELASARTQAPLICN